MIANFNYDYLHSPISNGVVDDEFIFIHHDFDEEWRVYKSNLCDEYYDAGFDMTLLNNPILFDWNQNDELLLNEISTFQVWRVNFDGTNLVKITNNEGSYRGPQWCLNDSLIYCVFNPYDSTHPLYPGKIILMDRDGEIVYVFPEGIGKVSSAIRGDKILTGANHTGIFELGYILISTKEFISMKEFDITQMNGFGLLGYIWLNDEEIIYALHKQAARKIIKLNITTLEETLIMEEDCENVGSGVSATFPNNQEEVLMSRSEYRYVANHPDSLYYFREIIKKNIVTGEEWLLDIDL